MKDLEMSGTREAPKPRLVELGMPTESWVDGFGNIENLGGGVFRVPVYRVHHAPNGDGPDEHEIVFYALVRLKNIASGLLTLRELIAGLLPARPPKHLPN